MSDYTLVTGNPYTDDDLTTCSQSRGRQNEPAVAVDPRNTDVIVGSSNDYCPVFNADGTFLGLGDIWLGYYRSEDAGSSFTSSLVPGYQGDESPYAARSHVRTADSGDPVLAWDNHGRLFAGSESSADPEGTAKTFGDVWVATYQNPDGEGGTTTNDGKEFVRSLDVARGSAAPNLLGKFHDKTSLEVDRTGGPCDGNVYFAWARFTGGSSNGFNSSVYFSRSTDHGATFSAPMKLSQTVHDIQFPDIAVTGNGHVYVTYRQFADVHSHEPIDAIAYNKSTNCGATFSQPHVVQTFEPYDPTDLDLSGDVVGDCGDFASECQSGYTFMRGGTQVRSAADQRDASHDYVYIVYDPTIPGTEVPSGTSYGSITSEDLPARYHQDVGSESGIYFFRLDGSNDTHTTPTLISDTGGVGLQRFPDISIDLGSMHAIWWDSRNDPCYSPQRPLGNCPGGVTSASLDAYGAAGTSALTWSAAERLSDTSSNPNWEQFGGRSVPFGGDYIYLSSVGAFSYGVWTDWRNVVAGTDPREGAESDGADVRQCRAQNPDGSWGPDTCPWAGGLDQNIYGALTP
ncbi:MAG: exo-alpha-sialidase [Actinobacteria bacterium]|nr:MAG: exo-alpha-sialidase [Actinomycetota bacterium]